MGTGLTILAISLVIYIIGVVRIKTIEKKMKVWAFLAAFTVAALAMLLAANIPMGWVIRMFNDSFGDFTKLAVKK